ncbi:MAG: hypothetical protein ABSF25_09170 [Bryobacteraceae bacterium]|jgi:rRNA-processing protein FCF1
MARDYWPASSRLAIDANVLSLLVVYHHCLCANVPALERGRILDEVRGRDGRDSLPPDRFDDLWQVFENATRRVVTQHVMAETLSPLRGWLKAHAEPVRKSAISLVEKFGVEEKSCPFRDLIASPADLLVLIKLGPTDAGLLRVAESIEAILISDDRDLRSTAWSRGIPAFPVRETPKLAQYPLNPRLGPRPCG